MLPILREILPPFAALAAVGFGYAILQPAGKLPKRSKGRPQFFLSDLFSRVLLLQLPLALLAVGARGHPQGVWAMNVAVVAVLIMLGVALLWWRAVRFLSQVGIEAPLRRTVFTVAIVPVAILGSLVSAIVLFWAVRMLLAPAQYGARSSTTLRIWAAALAIPFICYLFRRLTFWVLSGANKE